MSSTVLSVSMTRWTTRAKVRAVAASIGGAVLGYVVQSTFTDGDIDPKHNCAGFSELN
jgi:hypothetical protein